MQSHLASPDFYTVGYEQLSLTELFTLLRDANVRCLIDVRARPWSRVADYNIEALEEKFTEYGQNAGSAIKYVSMPSLGNPYRDPSWKEEYLKMISGKTVELEKLHAIIAGCMTALMCYERDPRDCHRWMLAGIIKKRYGLDYSDLRENR
jgi:uncharacterized protein (DUF488 family)